MSTPARTRTARCSCGGFTAVARGEPKMVHLCSCHECQRRSGSAFTYASVFAENAVTVEGERRTFRAVRDQGRWIEFDFCPACGVSVIWRVEAYPGLIGIPVGCFADSDFPPPQRQFWASQQHRWFSPPPGVDIYETQPG